MKYDRVQHQWRGNEHNLYHEARRENHRVAKEKLELLFATHTDGNRSTPDVIYTKPIPGKDGRHTLYAKGTTDKANPETGVFLYDIVIQRNGVEEIKAQVDVEGDFITYPAHIAERDRGAEDFETINALDAMQYTLDTQEVRSIRKAA